MHALQSTGFALHITDLRCNEMCAGVTFYWECVATQYAIYRWAKLRALVWVSYASYGVLTPRLVPDPDPKPSLCGSLCLCLACPVLPAVKVPLATVNPTMSPMLPHLSSGAGLDGRWLRWEHHGGSKAAAAQGRVSFAQTPCAQG